MIFSLLPTWAMAEGDVLTSMPEAKDGVITLENDVELTEQFLVEADQTVTLDLNGHSVKAVTGFSPANGGVVGVKHGGSLTIQDSNGGGTIDYNGCAYAAVAVTVAGDTNSTQKATLVVDGGTLIGNYYGISGNGKTGRGNTEITINGGTIRGTAENDSTGIYHPQAGTLTINGGTIEGAVGVYVKCGVVTASVNAGTIKGVGEKANFKHNGNGFDNTGDAFVVENCDYPGGAPNPSIEGGTFISENASAVASYAYGKEGENDRVPVTGFVTGGTFSDLSVLDYLGEGANVTIELQDNVTLDETLNIRAEGKTITLDLNKHTLTGRTNLYAGTLNIKNGTVAGGDEQALNVYGSAETATNYSVLNIANDVTVTADKFAICMFGPVYNAKTGYGAVINMAGKVETNGAGTDGAIFVSGNLGNAKDATPANNVINITGSVTSESDAALALHGTATVSIEDGAKLTGNTAVTVKRGTLNVTGGTITSNGDYVNPASANGNGTEMTGAAVSVSSTYNAYGKIDVNISGGTFTSEKGLAVQKYVSAGSAAAWTTDPTIEITGGTFTSGLECNLSDFIADGYTQVGDTVVKQLAEGVTVTGDAGVELTPEEQNVAAEAIEEIKTQINSAADTGITATNNAAVAAVLTGATLAVEAKTMEMTTPASDESEVPVAPVVKSVTFDVTPKDAGGAPVSALSSAITFELPVPDAWAGKNVEIVHTHGSGKSVSFSKVQGESNCYVNVTSGEFSLYQLTALTEDQLKDTDYAAMVQHTDGSIHYYSYDEEAGVNEILDAIKDAIDHDATLVLLADVDVRFCTAEVEAYLASKGKDSFEVDLNGDNTFDYPWDYSRNSTAPFTIANAPEAEVIKLEPLTATEKHVDETVTVVPKMYEAGGVTAATGGYAGVYLEVTYDKEYLRLTVPGAGWTEINDATATEGKIKFFDYDGVSENTLPDLTFEVIKADPTKTSIDTLVSVVKSQYVKTANVGMSSVEPYEFETGSNATITIASIPVELPTLVERVYNGTAWSSGSFDCVGYTVYGDGYNDPPKTVAGTNVGEYPVTLTLPDYNTTGKYCWPAGESFDATSSTANYVALKITQAPNAIESVTVSDDNVVAFGESYTPPTVEASWGADTATFAYAAWTGEVPPTESDVLSWDDNAPTNAGKYAVKVTIPEDQENHNWADATGYGVFEIEKGVLTITLPTLNVDTTFTEEIRTSGHDLLNEYGSIMLGDVAVNDVCEYGTIEYYYTDEYGTEPASDTTANLENAKAPGTYRVWFKFVPGSNYELAEDQSAYVNWTQVKDKTNLTRTTVVINKGTLQQEWFQANISPSKPATGHEETVLTGPANTTNADAAGALNGPNAVTYKYAVTKADVTEAPTTGWVESYENVKVTVKGIYNVWIQVSDALGYYETAPFNMGTFELTAGQYTAFKIGGYLNGNPAAKKTKDQPAKDLILVFAVDGLGFKYGSTAMFDVSGMGYSFDTINSRASEESTVEKIGQEAAPEVGYTKVYAYLVSGDTTTKAGAGDLTKVAMTGTDISSFNTISTFNENVYDVNENGSTDVGDASDVYAVGHKGTAATTLISKALLADTNRDGKVDVTVDVNPIRNYFITGDYGTAPVTPAGN